VLASLSCFHGTRSALKRGCVSVLLFPTIVPSYSFSGSRKGKPEAALPRLLSTGALALCRRGRQYPFPVFKCCRVPPVGPIILVLCFTSLCYGKGFADLSLYSAPRYWFAIHLSNPQVQDWPSPCVPDCCPTFTPPQTNSTSSAFPTPLWIS